MKYIENKMVALEGRARHFAIIAHAAVVDTEGAYTTLAHFLCGENTWGFHNDLRFSLPPGNVRQGIRIVAAAEHAMQYESDTIVLSNEDYEVLMSAVSNPQRHKMEMPIPTALARAILPLLDTLENASDHVREPAQTEPAPAMQPS